MTPERLEEISGFEEWTVKDSLEYRAIKDLLDRIAEVEKLVVAGRDLFVKAGARIEELEAALEPYAKCYEKIKDKPWQQAILSRDFFRRAAEVLGKA